MHRRHYPLWAKTFPSTLPSFRYSRRGRKPEAGAFGIAAGAKITRDRESERWIKWILENVVDGVITVDERGVVRTSRIPAVERTFGYPPDEIIGREAICLLIRPERQHEEEIVLERIRRGDRVEHYESVRVRKDGRRIDVSLTVSPVLDAHGRIVGTTKIARDIREKKRNRR